MKSRWTTILGSVAITATSLASAQGISPVTRDYSSAHQHRTVTPIRASADTDVSVPHSNGSRATGFGSARGNGNC